MRLFRTVLQSSMPTLPAFFATAFTVEPPAPHPPLAALTHTMLAVGVAVRMKPSPHPIPTPFPLWQYCAGTRRAWAELVRTRNSLSPSERHTHSTARAPTIVRIPLHFLFPSFTPPLPPDNSTRISPRPPSWRPCPFALSLPTVHSAPLLSLRHVFMFFLCSPSSSLYRLVPPFQNAP